MERVSRQSPFLVKDYYKCIHPTDAETLPSKIPNWLLMIHTRLCWRVAEREGWCKNRERESVAICILSAGTDTALPGLW